MGRRIRGVGNGAVSELQQVALSLGVEDRQLNVAGACSVCPTLRDSWLLFVG